MPATIDTSPKTREQFEAMKVIDLRAYAVATRLVANSGKLKKPELVDALVKALADKLPAPAPEVERDADGITQEAADAANEAQAALDNELEAAEQSSNATVIPFPVKAEPAPVLHYKPADATEAPVKHFPLAAEVSRAYTADPNQVNCPLCLEYITAPGPSLAARDRQTASLRAYSARVAASRPEAKDVIARAKDYIRMDKAPSLATAIRLAAPAGEAADYEALLGALILSAHGESLEDAEATWADMASHEGGVAVVRNDWMGVLEALERHQSMRDRVARLA